jgi:hypothetical protein
VTPIGEVIQDLLRRRQEIDDAIVILRRLETPASGRPAALERKAKPRANGKTEQRRAARQMWDNGIPAKEIAAKLEVNLQSVYNWKHADQWPAREES